ncbi:hypothetical protein GCM10027443_23110 [Pontibacter brevis]
MKGLILLLCLIGGSFASHGQDSKQDAETAAKDYANNTLNIDRNLKTNLYVQDGIIHLFMFEDGSLILVGYPTTATDKNTFQVHLFHSSNNTDPYFFAAEGDYQPTLYIDGGVAALTPVIKRQDFPIVGPFTDEVTFTIRRVTGGVATTLDTHTVKISKTIHASVGTGFVFSTLKNPTNVKVIPLNNDAGESTLLADNPQGNATLALMATLYPWGRNSLMMPGWKSLRDRAGIVVGTTIASSDKNFENLYLGLQYDFAIGGSIVFGADIAERQKIRGVDYDKFEFGKTVFTGELDEKLYQEVGIGFFVGVQVDSRIFAKMLGN